MNNLRSYFQLDPDITFLNHGSFGATPLPVFEVYQEWQRRLERQPVRFFSREATPALRAARETLGAYLNARPEDLVFVHNATFAINVVARSLNLQPGDEVLTTNHEYGACSNAWEAACARRGARYVRQPLAVPIADDAALIAELWQGVTSATRVIYLSHITSPTAQILPVVAICARARAAGILTVIDGAHAPGQIELDLTAIDADVYAGNLHKWLCAPKGAGFLWVRPDLQSGIEPLVTSWGSGPERGHFEESDFISALQWQGTDDLSSFLSVPAAIAFQAEHDWPAVRRHCHALLTAALDRLAGITGMAPAYMQPHGFYAQMAIAPLPPQPDLLTFKDRLYDDYAVEAPCPNWQGRHFLRISVQGYNNEADLHRLEQAVRALLASRP